MRPLPDGGSTRPALSRARRVLQGVVGLLIACVWAAWVADALAACPPPATTVFFVNGIDQSVPDANTSLEALRQRLGGQLRGDCLNFRLAYNDTSVPLTFHSDAVDSNVRFYRAELALTNKVILVAHSNGNVYADEGYGRLTPAERTSVGVVSVATIIGSVPGDGPYVTLVEDTYVATFPGALRPNTTNTGGFCPEFIGCHGFVTYYVNGAVSGPKIVQDVSDTVPRLARPPAGSFAGLELGETDFGSGDTLRTTVRVTNGAPARAIDFYLGYLWPDRTTATFITSLSPFAGVTVGTHEPGRFQPLIRNALIQQGLDVTFPDVAVLTFAPDFPEGDLLLFAAMTATGTLDVVGNLATIEFSFSP